MVMSQSLYQQLKIEHPDAELHVMAPSWCLPLLARMPEVDQPVLMPVGHGQFALKDRWQLGRQLRQEHYDWAIILPNSWKSALIPWFAGIPRRTGWTGESRYGLLNDLRPNKKTFPMMVQRYVALALEKTQIQSPAQLPDYRYPALKTDPANQQQALQKLVLGTDRPILSLCPGAEFGPAKRWPDRYYADIAARWIAEKNGQVWIFGSQKDVPVANDILNQLPTDAQQHCSILAGQTSIPEAIDLMALSQLVLCNDSGLMHIAAALNVSLVAVYGSTSTKYTPPLSEQVAMVHTDISCRPCFKRECPLGHLKCLNELYPEQVWHAIEQQLVPVTRLLMDETSSSQS